MNEILALAALASGSALVMIVCVSCVVSCSRLKETLDTVQGILELMEQDRYRRQRARHMARLRSPEVYRPQPDRPSQLRPQPR